MYAMDWGHRWPFREKNAHPYEVAHAITSTECWETSKRDESLLHTAEMSMLSRILAVSVHGHVGNSTIREWIGVAAIHKQMRDYRLRWYRDTVRVVGLLDTVINAAFRLNVDVRSLRGRPKLRWLDIISSVGKPIYIRPEDAVVRRKWRSLIRTAGPVPTGKRLEDDYDDLLQF